MMGVAVLQHPAIKVQTDSSFMQQKVDQQAQVMCISAYVYATPVKWVQAKLVRIPSSHCQLYMQVQLELIELPKKPMPKWKSTWLSLADITYWFVFINRCLQQDCHIFGSKY